jgi:hypothetical protein
VEIELYLPVNKAEEGRDSNIMRTTYFRTLRWLAAGVAVLQSMDAARGQGTITFGAESRWTGTDYSEAGMGLHLVQPNPSEPYHDWLVITRGFANEAQNPTPYMFFLRQNSPDNYVAIRLTTGTAFGLGSVQLGDPYNPSLSPVTIPFVGHLADGSSVTNMFTTPGNGATTLASYAFSSDFASGLTSVDILATRWAMDNLVFIIPEPGACVLLSVGLLGLALRRRARREP